MPWLSIIVWLLSYFVASKNGASKGQAALLATGLAAGTYYLADPANTENVLGVTMGDAKTVPGSTTDVKPSTPGIVSTVGGLGSTLIEKTADVAKDWGPVGTVGAITAGAGLASGDNKWLWIGGAALLAVLMLK